MANRVKVAGYAQKVFYPQGIEYRNFAAGLVGNQPTNNGGTPLFTIGNFQVTANLDGKTDRIFVTPNFGSFVTLQDLGVTHDEVRTILYQNSKLKLNLNKSDFGNYAYFGSLREFIRVSLEYIIANWPASLYITPLNVNNPIINYDTVQDYVYDEATDQATFKVNVDRAVNNFDINYMANGATLDRFSSTTDLKTLVVSFEDYVVSSELGDFPVLEFTGSTSMTADFIYFRVSGNAFDGIDTLKPIYHVKPNALTLEKFFNGLSDFESYLLNRLTIPAYTSTFKYSMESELGTIINSQKSLTWPVSDGYNIDFDSATYTNYVTELLEMSEAMDMTKTNLVDRFFVSQSISDFDTLPYANSEDVVSGQKMNSVLKIYGREFDEVKKYIDGLKFAHVVTYDKQDNTPDAVVKNLARIMGWDLVGSLTSTDLMGEHLTLSPSTYSGHTRGLTPVEAEIEMWRRLILNTPWLWKSKGTRKSIEFLFKFIGAPEGLVQFNEYVYVADQTINMEVFGQVVETLLDTTDISNLNVDADGFPQTLPDTPDMYFQKGGLWYRETGGPNASEDILEGNNPHMGPYDAGQEYIDQFRCLVPDFEPVTILTETTGTEVTNLFTNYDNGIFDAVLTDPDTTVPVDLEVVNQYGQPITGCTVVTGEIFETEPEFIILDECGCPIDDDNEASIRINIAHTIPQPPRCVFEEFTLDESGLVLFTYDGVDTFNIQSACCSLLGFTPEIQNGLYVCRWGDPVDPCFGYTFLMQENGYSLFQDSNGATTQYVPTGACCPVETNPESQPDGTFRCKGTVVITGPCDDYVFNGFTSGGYAVFTHNGSNVSVVPTTECCTVLGYTAEPAAFGSGYKCFVCPESVSQVTGSDGMIIFTAADGTTYSEVPSAGCCPVGTTPQIGLSDDFEDPNAAPVFTCLDDNWGSGGNTAGPCGIRSFTYDSNTGGGANQWIDSGTGTLTFSAGSTVVVDDVCATNDNSFYAIATNNQIYFQYYNAGGHQIKFTVDGQTRYYTFDIAGGQAHVIKCQSTPYYNC